LVETYGYIFDLHTQGTMGKRGI